MPSGGICVDGRRERIRTSSALRSGAPGVTNALAPSGACGICHFEVGRNSASYTGLRRAEEPWSTVRRRFQQQPERRNRASPRCGSCRSWSTDSRAPRACARRAPAMRGGAATSSGRAGCEQPSSTSVAQRHHVRGERLGVRRAGIAIGRELQRGEAEDLGAARGRGRRGTRRPTGCCGDLPGAISATSAARRPGASIGVGLRLVPHVARKHPARRAGLHQQPRLDPAAAERELLPEPRARPGKSQRRRRARRSSRRRQPDPARLRAPSVHSGYCGENGRLRGSIASASPLSGVEPGLRQQPRRRAATAPRRRTAPRTRRAIASAGAARRREQARAATAVVTDRPPPADRSARARGCAPAAATAGRRTAP